MKKIPLPKDKYALVDDEDFHWMSLWKWHCNSAGYVMRTDKNGSAIFMHRLLTNAPEEKEVDHVNHNTLDNRRGNLRICTKAENQFNQLSTKNTKSGFKGVHPVRNKWRAYINKSKRYHLGYFNTSEEAAKAYNKKAIELFGEFAMLNKIEA